MSEAGARRICFLTFHKCGSQWVRDVLTSPGVMHSATGFAAANPGANAGADADWPDCPPKTFSGPLYDVAYRRWRDWRAPGDKALVVLRDPRDVIVSWLFSVAYSHRLLPRVAAYRSLLLSMNPLGQLLIAISRFASTVRYPMSTWAERSHSDDEFVTRYETLVGDQEGEFARIAGWLGWEVPEPSLHEAVAEHRFESRSGRRRGEQNVHSHFRNGEPGDWRNHFDRLTGRVLETLCPGLLSGLGYEREDNWPETLREPEVSEVRAGSATNQVVHELRAEIERLREDKLMLERACEKRLDLIEQLNKR